MNKAHYTSEGAIRELMLWDTASYKLKNDSQYISHGHYAPVYKRNKRLLESLDSKMPGARVFFFFRANCRGQQPTLPFTVGNVTFVAVNFFRADAFIPTRWVQDVLVISDASTIYYDPTRMNPGLLNVLNTVFGYKYNFFAGRHGQVEGGNLQRIVLEDGDALVSGRRPAEQSIPLPGSASTRIVELWNPIFAYYDKQTFHLDNYFHWIGFAEAKESNSNNDQAYYLSSIAYYEGTGGAPQRELRLNRAIKDSADKLEKELKKFGVKKAIAIPVPLLLIPHNNHKNNYFSLSYTNCHIELNEARVTIYFPDYSKALKDLAAKVFLRDKRALDAIGTVLYYTLSGFQPEEGILDRTEAAYLEAFRKDPEKGVDEFVQLMKKKLESAFKVYPRIRVRFIGHRFQYLAQRFGSLHCMSKVMERS